MQIKLNKIITTIIVSLVLNITHALQQQPRLVSEETVYAAITALAVSPSGEVACGENHRINFYNQSGNALYQKDAEIYIDESYPTASMQEKNSIIEHGDRASSCEYKPNAFERILATGTMNGNVKIWDTRSRKLLHTLSHCENGLYSRVTNVTWHPHELLLASATCNKALVWDLRRQGREGSPLYVEGLKVPIAYNSQEDPDYLTRKTETTGINCVQWSADGEELYIAFDNHILEKDATHFFTTLVTLKHNSKITKGIVSPDLSMVARISGNSSEIWDTQENNCLYTLKHDDSVRQLAWTPDSKKLIVALEDTILNRYEQHALVTRLQRPSEKSKIQIWEIK